MSIVYLIRHGEPATTGVLLGQMDPPLSQVGKVQCTNFLNTIQVKTAYTSPLQRAKETAHYLKAERIIEMSDLAEIHQGDWTGISWKQIEEGWPELAKRKMTNWLTVPAPGGEEWHAFLDRIRRAWKLIRAASSPMAVVAHQGVNAALVHLIDGRDPLTFTQGYGEVIPIEYD